MRIITALFVAVLSTATRPALALNEALFFRLSPAGTIEAVVAGDDAGPCAFKFRPPTSVVVTGSSIAITTPNFPLLPCLPPPPPHPRYEVVANLGALPAPLYSVSWTMGITVLSSSLSPGSLLPQGIPTLSSWGLLALALAVVMLGVRRVQRVRNMNDA